MKLVLIVTKRKRRDKTNKKQKHKGVADPEIDPILEAVEVFVPELANYYIVEDGKAHALTDIC